ncbi:MAG: dehydrogenase, partial [Chthoniobacter sp.]
LEDTHSVANSLRWGPDGWLYGAHGSTVTAKIVRPGIDKEPIAEIEGQDIWRYQPETHRFEVFCEGGGNTFGVEIDAKGRIFSGHNGGDTRGFHYMQGAYLKKGFDKHGPLSNPFTFGYFDMMEHAKVQRFTHTFLIYEGGALNASHLGHLFGPEPLQNQVVETEITPQGSTFKTRDLQRPITSTDPWFRPVDIKAGPDGVIYLFDWYVPQLAHSRTYSDLQQGALDLARGRIYRLRAKDSTFKPTPDYSKETTAQLVQDLRSENKWVRQTVQRLIADRHDAAIVPDVKKQIDANDGQYALELLWALHGSGGLDAATGVHLLDHKDPYVRMWTARLLGDADSVTPEVAKKLAEVAEKETNVETRAQFACTAKRLPVAQDLPIVRALLGHDADTSDPRQPLLLWWAIEAKAQNDRDAVLAFFKDSPLWDRALVKQYILERIMRRYAQTGARKDLLTCATIFDMSPTPEHSKILMTGFEAAFKGRPLSGLPDELVAAMSRHHVGSVALSLRQGDAGAIDKALKVIADEKASAQTRLEYVTILGEVKAPASVPVLLELVEKTKDEPLRKAALAALAPYDDTQIAKRVVAGFPKLSKASQPAALSLLASRAGSAVQLISAVESGSISHQQVPLEVVRKIKLFTTDDLTARTEKIWGSAGRATSADMAQKIQRLGVLLRDGGTGDPYAGHTVFMGTCGACHTLHNQGGQVGPDLTKFKRDDLDALLLNIINPNAEIREGYENFLVTTKDGRVINGFLVEQAPQVVVLRGLDGQNVSLTRAEIADMKNAGVSLMPEGLLDAYTDQQVRDLFAYLRTTQPLLVKGGGGAP